MAKKKIVFIIPGFRHKSTTKGYKTLSTLLKKDGYVPIVISIPWKQSTISQNTEFFLKKYKHKLESISNVPCEVYLLGFSYGAIIAFLASTTVKVKGLMLCSLSPYFKEDLPKFLPSKTLLQKARYENFSTLHSAKLAKKITAKKVVMMYGSRESRVLIHRVQNTFDDIPVSTKYLFFVKHAQHNISDKKYVSAIHYLTKTLL